MRQELLDLDQIRLDEDLTYQALAERIGISHTILVRALHRTTEPRDRTLHKMRRYLESRKASGRKRKAS